MKKLLSAMSLILGLGFATAQQTAPASTTTTNAARQVQQAQKTVKTTEAKATKTVNASKNTAVKLKKDGTPDKRYKANKRLKKDGTPDKRYKVNK